MTIVGSVIRHKAFVATVAAIALVAAPHLVYPMLLIKILCFALFAAAFNFLLGSCGLLSFGHAAFYGSAAYVAAHAAKAWNLPFELAILCGTASASALGLFFGFIAVRRSALQFAMITLALAQLIFFLALQLPFTHAEDGITGVARGFLLGTFPLDNLHTLYCAVTLIVTAGLMAIYRITHSPFGELLCAFRDNEPRAKSLGYEVQRFKILAFALSATLAGLAGATKALSFKLATLTDVHWTMSGTVILMTLLGGLGTFWGPVVGAAVIVILEDRLADSGLPIQPVIGAIFILCILIFRRGLIGELQHRIAKIGNAHGPTRPVTEPAGNCSQERAVT